MCDMVYLGCALILPIYVTKLLTMPENGLSSFSMICFLGKKLDIIVIV